MNILIVEDNRHMRRMLMEMVLPAVAPNGVHEAADAGAARTLCRDLRPEVVLMDIGLPDASGIDLTAEIKAMLPQSQIVIVSNHRNRASQDAASAAGASAYLFKDEVYERLLPTLLAILAGRGLA